MSNQPFETETLEQHGKTYLIEKFYDDDASFPWENSDCHGPVRMGNKEDKKPCERLLNQPKHGCYAYFYDFQAACKLARKEWGAKNKKEAAELAERDFAFLKAFMADEWFYIGVVMTLLDSEGNKTDGSESLWLIESDTDFPSLYQDLIGDIGA